MPRIQLKPNSPEYEDFKQRPQAHKCDMPECHQEAGFRAPKDRNLKEYYNFCEIHIREYNSAWNYFSDMSEEEQAAHMRAEFYGHRPTWKYGVNADDMDELYRKARETYTGEKEDPLNSERYRKTSERIIAENTPETEALKIMDLSPPLTLQGIKKRYKELAKKFHPDFNPGDKEAEEKLKEVNMAYTILKMAYGEYEKMIAKA